MPNWLVIFGFAVFLYTVHLWIFTGRSKRRFVRQLKEFAEADYQRTPTMVPSWCRRAYARAAREAADADCEHAFNIEVGCREPRVFVAVFRTPDSRTTLEYGFSLWPRHVPILYIFLLFPRLTAKGGYSATCRSLKGRGSIATVRAKKIRARYNVKIQGVDRERIKVKTLSELLRRHSDRLKGKVPSVSDEDAFRAAVAALSAASAMLAKKMVPEFEPKSTLDRFR